MSQEDMEQQAYNYWKSFIDEITYNNRFFPNHPIIKLIDNYAEQHPVFLKAGTILYRARIIDYNSEDAQFSGFSKFIHGQDFGEFEGFDEQHSYVPPARAVPAGRINPEKIVYLYAAQEIITAIAETRPRVFDHISVAKIELLHDVQLVDFRHKDDSKKSDFSTKIVKNFTTAFSHPCRESIEYIPTQFISEYIKTLNYDGILFRSSFDLRGTNITLFQPGVAKAIASTVYRMDNIFYRARRIFPINSLESFEIIATSALQHDLE